MNTNPDFTMFVGPMFSSKTSKMLSLIDRYFYQKKDVLILKPKKDDRYALHQITSHTGVQVDAKTVESGDDIIKQVDLVDGKVDVVAVDEAFMIDGSSEALIWLFQQRISIAVSTLDISATGQPFKETKEMLPWATNVVNCTAVCTICSADAHYTHRRIASNEEIQVGGKELYEPRCFTHHVLIDKTKEF